MPDTPPILTPDQRLRVFVSSTLQELAEERRVVRRAIERLRLAPVMFELGARPHPPRDLYRAYLDQSHIFIGIYWQSYGWVAPEESVSGLEDEYDRSGDRPKLIYIKTPSPDRQPRLGELLNRIKGDDRASYKSFRTAKELGRLVEDDLVLLLTERFEASRELVDEARVAEREVSRKRPLRQLPASSTTLVGRKGELEAVLQLLRDDRVRLVTLSGPGGVGKTRLGLAVARQLLDEFEDGIAFVPLAAVRDPSLVLPAIARAIGLVETGHGTLLDQLNEALREKRMLVFLDNFEQVIEAAPVVGDLLTASASFKVLVTSRAVLRLSGEHDFPVPPLSVPGARGEWFPDALSRFEAVQLFLERTRAVKPDFELTPQNAQAVADICRRLDGLPLAIELAAARVRLLPPQAMLARLDRSLPLLTGGARDLPERQQTMRAAIEWSYQLLEEPERRLLNQLSVFRGGWKLEAAETVGQADHIEEREVLDLLSSLTEQSMVLTEGTEGDPTRYRMLAPIREYAWAQLEQSGEAEATRRRHADFYLELAEHAREELQGSVEWLDRLELEHDNVRAALSWALASGEAEIAARIGSGMMMFWWIRNYHREGRSWMDEVLVHAEQIPPSSRVRVLVTALAMANGQADDESAMRYSEQLMQLSRQVGGHAYAEAYANVGFGLAATNRGEHEAAIRHLEEAIALYRAAGVAGMVAQSHAFIGTVLLLQNDAEGASSRFEQALALFREIGDTMGIYNTLFNLAQVALVRGNYDRVAPLLEESIILSKQMGDKANVAYCLEALAAAAGAQGNGERSARLFGAAEGLLRDVGVPVYGFYKVDRSLYERTMAAARSQLGDVAFEAIRAEGRVMPIEQIIAYALDKRAMESNRPIRTPGE